MKRLSNISQNTVARLAGLFYLLYIVIFASSSSLQSKSLAWTNVGSSKPLIPSELLFRIGFTTEIISVVFFFLAAWALYVLLKPVNRNLALLFLLINLAGIAVECGGALLHFSALQVAYGPDYSAAFSTSQVQALAILLVKSSANVGTVTALLYGLWLFPLGWLIIKSGFLPRVLGVLLLLDGSSLVICFLQLCLLPAYQKFTYPLYAVMFIAEFSLSLWLLIKGVKEVTPVSAAAKA